MDVSKITFIVIAVLFAIAIWKRSDEKKEVKQEEDEDLYLSIDDDSSNWRRKYAIDPYDHPYMLMDSHGNFLEDFDDEQEYNEHIREEFFRLNKFPWDRQKIVASFNPPWITRK